jgi:hypothetical protein
VRITDAATSIVASASDTRLSFLRPAPLFYSVITYGKKLGTKLSPAVPGDRADEYGFGRCVPGWRISVTGHDARQALGDATCVIRI